MNKRNAKDIVEVLLSSENNVANNANISPIFTNKEKECLITLAKEVSEIAKRDIERRKSQKWRDLNELKSEEPLIFADPENGWNEIIPAESLQCQNKLAREWEMFLRKQIFWATEMRDDKVIEAYFDVPYVFSDSGWGFDLKIESTGDGGAFHIIPSIVDYEKDFDKLQFPEIIVDYDKSNQVMELAEELFGNILKVRRRTQWWWSLGMTLDYVMLRGLDNLMMDMILYPEWVHKMMNFLTEGYLKRLSFLEKEGLLSSNNEGTYVGSGGFGYTGQLPVANEIQGCVTAKDMWGFGESQETVGVSPEMFNEMILPYQIKILSEFGLNCYGCCEPINSRWAYVKNIPNLRRVSSSPWADRKVMASQLRRDYIISIKPSPTPLSRPEMNEEEVRKELREILEDTKGCVVEIIMKDNHTLGNNPRNITRWVEIAREEIANMYH